MRRKFHRGERLKSRKEIGRLFQKGAKSANSYPIRAMYAVAAERRSPFPVQVTFVVPKRKFKRAPDRNLLKRRMREAFRLNKHLLTEPTGHAQLAVLLIYTGREVMDYQYIEKKVRKVLRAIADAPATE